MRIIEQMAPKALQAIMGHGLVETMTCCVEVADQKLEAASQAAVHAVTTDRRDPSGRAD